MPKKRINSQINMFNKFFLTEKKELRPFLETEPVKLNQYLSELSFCNIHYNFRLLDL